MEDNSQDEGGNAYEGNNDNLGLNLRALGLTGKAKPGRKSVRNKSKKIERQRVERTHLKRGVTRNANERRERAKAERNAAVERRRVAANFRGNLQGITKGLGGIGFSEPAAAAAYPSAQGFSGLPSFSLAAPTFTGAPAAAAYEPAYEPAGFSLAPAIFTGPALSREEREAARRLRIQELGLEHAEGEGEGEEDENNGPGDEWGGEERTGGGLFQRIKALETYEELHELEDQLSESALADPSIRKALKKQQKLIDAAEEEQRKADKKFDKNKKTIRRALTSQRKGKRRNTGAVFGYTRNNSAMRRAKMNAAREGRAIEERNFEEAVIAEEKRARKANRRAAAAEESALADMFKGLMKEGGRRKRRTLRKKRGSRRSRGSRR